MKCDFCKKTIIDNSIQQKQTTSKFGYHFCDYECMEAFYGDIPEDEDFCN